MLIKNETMLKFAKSGLYLLVFFMRNETIKVIAQRQRQINHGEPWYSGIQKV